MSGRHIEIFKEKGVINLLGLYLKDYYRFEHETSVVYRSHSGKVHCTRTITIHFLILELLPFVIFSYCNLMSGRHIEIFKEKGVTKLLGLYLKDFYRFEHETSGVYRSH